MATALGRSARIRNGSRSRQAQILRAGDVALSFRHDAHGQHAHLHDWRRVGPGKAHPRTWTNNNIAEFQRVLRRFGFSYDWRREISTCEPEYYRWNQWFFLRMLERGLAYRKKSRVNWCPKCC